MLAELKKVRQVPGERRRRWFEDDYFDLIVWYDPDGAPYGFQLCYDKTGRERVVTWRRDEPPTHDGIDDGESGEYGYKMSPVLEADGIFPAAEVVPRFRDHATGIDPAVAVFVLERLPTDPEHTSQKEF